MTDSREEGVEKDSEGGRGENCGDGVTDAEDGLLLVIGPGEVSQPALDVDQQ